jgi:hypothetical protein
MVVGAQFRNSSMRTLLSTRAGPYLGDTLAMGRAFLTLYSFTADPAWLGRAEHAAGFIAANFKAASGYLSNANGKDQKTNGSRAVAAARDLFLESPLIPTSFFGHRHS